MSAAPEGRTRIAGVLASRWLLAGVVVASGVAGVTIATTSSTSAQSPQRELGEQLYETQCSSCHGVDGAGVNGRGPSLEHEGAASADFVLRTGRMPLAAPQMQATRGPVRYSEPEIVALVDYLAELGDGPGIPDVDPERGDVAVGGQLYRLNCAACHVASGAGAPIGGGRRAPSLADSTPTQVGQAILVGPGSMPVFGSFDEADIDDVAAYVAFLQDDDATGTSSFGGAGPAAEGLAAWLLALVPLIALTRWIGAPKPGRDRPVETGDLDDGAIGDSP